MSFDAADPIGSVFAEIIGRPCWLAQRGHASFLTMEFGEPHLEVREPMEEPSSRSLRRRRITVRGDWHLWIYCCRWTLREADVLRGTSEALDQDIEHAARLLNGQNLRGIVVEPATGRSHFGFEGGLVLATSRLDEAELDLENWMLKTPGGHWLSYRADGRYSWHPGATAPEDAVWSEIPEARR